MRTQLGEVHTVGGVRVVQQVVLAVVWLSRLLGVSLGDVGDCSLVTRGSLV